MPRLYRQRSSLNDRFSEVQYVTPRAGRRALLKWWRYRFIGVVVGIFMASQDRVEVHTSRVWALFHGNFTQLLFPDRMIADKSNGFTRKSVTRWYVPWVRTEKHLPLTPFIQVDRDTDVVWDTVTVESSAGGGADALRVHRVAKRKARRFVKKVNEWLSSLGSSAKVAQPIR
jgi:hypothetical protein